MKGNFNAFSMYFSCVIITDFYFKKNIFIISHVKFRDSFNSVILRKFISLSELLVTSNFIWLEWVISRNTRGGRNSKLNNKLFDIFRLTGFRTRGPKFS